MRSVGRGQDVFQPDWWLREFFSRLLTNELEQTVNRIPGKVSHNKGVERNSNMLKHSETHENILNFIFQ